MAKGQIGHPNYSGQPNSPGTGAYKSMGGSAKGKAAPGGKATRANMPQHKHTK